MWPYFLKSGALWDPFVAIHGFHSIPLQFTWLDQNKQLINSCRLIFIIVHCYPIHLSINFYRYSCSNLCFLWRVISGILQPPEYMPENLTVYSAWVGGAILAKVVFPQNQHVTKADYDETGPSIVHRKCFWWDSTAQSSQTATSFTLVLAHVDRPSFDFR